MLPALPSLPSPSPALAAALLLMLLPAVASADATGGAGYGSASQVQAPAPQQTVDTGGVDPSQPPPLPEPAPLPFPAPAPAPAPLPGQTARLLSSGRAVAPAGAPVAVRQIIEAGNRIARMRYVWGGGHRRWEDRGYDCSGSVSYALHGAGLLDSPLVSGELARWGQAGAGRWVTVYANAGHVYMVVAGLRFDTSGRRGTATRWQLPEARRRGFKVRHPAGL